MYKHFVKRLFDIVFSFIGIVVFAVPMLIFALIIKFEDPGPSLFVQKRVGLHKTYFKMYKFRSMRLDTPHDIPTHELENPEQYLLKVGKIMRRFSIDELPQLFNIFSGQMSIIGPRPSLWNQYDLIEERDKYGANDVKPGLTGLAQINGRDELEIPVKAKLDGEYAENLSFLLDVKCFFGTFSKAVNGDGYIEGGTGELEKQKEMANK